MVPEDRNSPLSTVKKAGKTVGVIFLIFLIIAVLFVLITPFFGWRTEIVLSGSMEPAIPTGSVVIARPLAPADISEGDIIMYSFLSGPGSTTHRVIKVNPGKELSFTTKGDANRSPDINPVLPVQVIGSIAYVIPYAGFLVYYIKTPLGIIVCLLIPVAVLVLSELLSLWNSQD